MEKNDGVKSKGYTIKGALAFVESRWGEEGKQKLIDTIDEEYRTILSARIIPSDWHPFAMQVRIYEVIDQLFGNGDLSLCLDVGRFTAEAELSTIHKILMKVGGAERLMKLSSLMWGRYYNSGKLDLAEIGNKKGIAVVKDFHPISKAFCMDFTGWMERTLELTGAKMVDVKHTDCVLDGFLDCKYEGSWE